MHPFHIIYMITALFRKLYSRLNQLEQFLAPTMAVGHKALFSSSQINTNWIKYGVLALIIGVLIFNVFETKHKLAQPHSGVLGVIEPILKGTTWVFLFTQIVHHLSSFNLSGVTSGLNLSSLHLGSIL
jgi:hypothetical protein